MENVHTQSPLMHQCEWLLNHLHQSSWIQSQSKVAYLLSLSHTLEISVSSPIYTVCVIQPWSWFGQGFCLGVMEISGHTAGTMAHRSWDSFPIAKPCFFFLTILVKEEEPEMSLSTTHTKLENWSLNQWLCWWYLECFLHSFWLIIPPTYLDLQAQTMFDGNVL